jgi:hypothetical protein
MRLGSLREGRTCAAAAQYCVASSWALIESMGVFEGERAQLETFPIRDKE